MADRWAGSAARSVWRSDEMMPRAAHTHTTCTLFDISRLGSCCPPDYWYFLRSQLSTFDFRLSTLRLTAPGLSCAAIAPDLAGRARSRLSLSPLPSAAASMALVLYDIRRTVSGSRYPPLSFVFMVPDPWLVLCGTCFLGSIFILHRPAMSVAAVSVYHYATSDQNMLQYSRQDSEGSTVAHA